MPAIAALAIFQFLFVWNDLLVALIYIGASNAENLPLTINIANLVTSLLAKTEFAVPRTVGRVNHPNNEWLFTEAWGVDVSVSTPRIMSALVEEAVTVGDVVRLFTFRQGNANLIELTLPADSPYVGRPAGLIPFPENCALVSILRDGQVYTPDAEQPIEEGDELLFVAGAEVEDALEHLLSPGAHAG